METLLSILNAFKGKKVLIVGDLMLDTYFKGEVTRVSAEAPIPIVKVEHEFHVLGGAGNVAANVVSLGGKATLFSFVGTDYQSEIVKSILKEKEIENFLDENERTIHKVRILGNGQQLARADFEAVKDNSFTPELKIILRQKASEADVIIVSDYAKGAITQDLMYTLSDFKGKIIADPKPKNKDLFKGIFLVKSNEKEALEMSPSSDVEVSGKKLKEELNTMMLITRGKHGMTLFTDQLVTIPTYAKEVFDVTGAGDTAIAAIALSIAAGASLKEAAMIANQAAGIKVEKAGTYAVSNSEVLSRLMKEESKILDLETLSYIVADLKKKGKKIVWTNGCFDLLHIGHTRYLQEAKKLGDILVVGLNSDDSVRRLKGPTRPIQAENERAEILASLEFVDYVTIYPDSTSERCLKELKPNLYVKGGDYSMDYLANFIEGKVVREHGGEIKIIPHVEGKSTTSLVGRIRLNGEENHAS